MKIKSLACAISLLSVSAINAQTLEITVTNLTQGMHFTPIIVSAHTAENSLYSVGTVASGELQAMAEGGDISGLAAGSYTCNISDLDNFCDDNITVDVLFNAGFTLQSVSTDESCGDGTGAIDLTILDATSPYVVTWDNGLWTHCSSFPLPTGSW